MEIDTPTRRCDIRSCYPRRMGVGGSNGRKWLLSIGALIASVASTSAWAQTGSRLLPLETFEKRLKSFSDDNDRRETLIRKWLADSGCKGARLRAGGRR